MNNYQEENIQIRQEITEFLELQIYGKKNSKQFARFTHVSFSVEAKEILKVIKNVIYFDDQSNALQNLNMIETQKIISHLMVNVSILEINLVHYIALIVAGCKDQAKFDLYERIYNRILSKQNKL